jgi:uncharacterized protein (DUF2235 family)
VGFAWGISLCKALWHTRYQYHRRFWQPLLHSDKWRSNFAARACTLSQILNFRRITSETSLLVTHSTARKCDVVLGRLSNAFEYATIENSIVLPETRSHGEEVLKHTSIAGAFHSRKNLAQSDLSMKPDAVCKWCDQVSSGLARRNPRIGTDLGPVTLHTR